LRVVVGSFGGRLVGLRVVVGSFGGKLDVGVRLIVGFAVVGFAVVGLVVGARHVVSPNTYVILGLNRWDLHAAELTQFSTTSNVGICSESIPALSAWK
jgi:hypothetical protein